MGCWKCWKCWECWKIYDFSTLSMFSMLSMLQKEGNAAQESPFIANAVRTKHSAGGAHKLHEGETARQGRQHSAEKRTSSAGRQERQLRKAGTRAAGSQKLRLWRSLFWKPMTKLSLSVARYAFICSSSLCISRASNHVPMIDMIISINTISPAINQNVKVVNTASIYFSSLILITALGLFFCVMLYFPLLCSLYPLPRLSFVNPAI